MIINNIIKIFVNYDLVNIFGELTDESLNFRQLPGNIFFYNSTILAYKGDVNSAPIAWQYSVNVDLSSSEVLTATYMSIQTGVSWLSVVNTKQGYYQCYIDSTHRYTVGVYDTQKTTGREYYQYWHSILQLFHNCILSLVASEGIYTSI